MKSIFFAFTLGAMLVLPAAGQAAAEYEHILHFDSRIEVRSNGVLSVIETIRVYAAGNQIRHGIYRDFPQIYHSQAGLQSHTGFRVVNVSRDGQPEDYHLASRENGTRVYMGSASVFVPTGVHTYELTYTTDRQLGFFSDHDELYWNVTGNGWFFPMDSVTATVTLPTGAVVTNLTAYTGPQGARGRDFTATNFANTARFVTTRSLPAENGLTIVVEWPKGFVAKPSVLAGFVYFLEDNRGLVLALAGFLVALAYYFITWSQLGRDPRRGVIIPRYAPPEGFSPAAVRFLWRMGFDNKALTASILNLAVKGAVKITESKEGIFRGRIYTLVPKKAHSPLSRDEGIVRDELVGDDLPITLQQDNYLYVQAAQKGLREYLEMKIQNEFFKSNLGLSFLGVLICLAGLLALLLDYSSAAPIPILLVGFFIAPLIAIAVGKRTHVAAGIILYCAILVVAIFIIGYTHQWFAPIILPVVFGTLAGMFHILLKAYTPKGRNIMDEIEGFKMYLGVAEKDRLNLENPPERTPQLFEMFLPYALALNVEQKWSEQFADVLAAASADPNNGGYSPVWYSGDSWNRVGSTGFATALGGSLAGAIAASSTAPGSSSGGGGGGGGGGGSSGGGGGGGGGGGW